MNNKLPEVLLLLDIEEFEIFEVKGQERKFRIDSNGRVEYFMKLSNCWEHETEVTLGTLLNGTHEVVKIPYKPKDGEHYLYLRLKNSSVLIVKACWNCDIIDSKRYADGNCYHVDHEFTDKEREEFKTGIMCKYLQSLIIK